MIKFGRKPIQDKFTDLKVSRQRKWQLRHPKEAAVISKRFNRSLKKRIYNRELMRKRHGYKERNLNARSYKEEKEQKRIWSI